MDCPGRLILYHIEQPAHWIGDVLPEYFSFDIVFGAWNMFSFSVCAGLGYVFLGLFSVLAKRTVHTIDLNNDLETVDITFFSPFWKPRTVTFHISEFQELYPSYFGYIRFELTSLGKSWIKLSKN